jgi:hypothetical protein
MTSKKENRNFFVHTKKKLLVTEIRNLVHELAGKSDYLDTLIDNIIGPGHMTEDKLKSIKELIYQLR